MLSDYIREMSGVIDETKLALFTRVDALFKLYTQVHTDILIGDLMNNNGSREYSDMLDEVQSFIEEGVDYIADEIGLDFADIDLDQKLLVLETLKQAETFEDSETIVRLFENDSSLQERITDVLAFVAGRDWSVFSDLIEDVSKDLLTALYGMHLNVKEAQEEITFVHRTKEIDRILAYIKKYPGTILERGVRESGYRPGLPLRPIFNGHIHELRDFATNDDPKNAAINIVGLLLVTNVPLVKLSDLARALSENIFKNTIFISKVNTEINIIASEVTANG